MNSQKPNVERRYDVLAAGIAAVDELLYVSQYPPINSKIRVLSSARRGGGPACTAIAAVSALQGRAAYVARFGSDDLSSYIKSSLDRRGVDISHMVFDATGGPYHSIIVVDSLGRRNVFYDPSLYQVVVEDDLPDSLIQSATLFLLDHLTEPGLTKVAKKVHNLGIPILSDLEGCSESVMELVALTDYLIVPKEFAIWASGESNPRDSCALLARTERLATVVTCGSEGCYFVSSANESVRYFPAFKVEVFDTNGCGDTFHGAFAVAVARGLAVDEAIVFSSAAAALKAMATEGRGRGWDALPTLDAVFQFLRSRLTDPMKSLLLEKLMRLGTLAHSAD